MLKASAQPAPSKAGSGLYAAVTGILILFGLLTGFSIGLPFLLLGVTLAGVAPLRGQRHLFWPPLLAVFSLIVGFALVTPLGCTTSSTQVVTSSRSIEVSPTQSTSCSNAVGIDYSGEGLYNPPLWPALLVGSTAASVIFFVTRRLLQPRVRR